MLSKNRAKGIKFPFKPILFLLMILLIGILSATVLAQDGDLDFTPDEDNPDSVSAPAESIWIPVSRDAFVASNSPNTNYGFDSFVRFGMMPSGLGAMRPMFYFNVNSYLPKEAHITKAEFHVYLLSVNPSGDCGRRYAAHHAGKTAPRTRRWYHHTRRLKQTCRCGCKGHKRHNPQSRKARRRKKFPAGPLL